MLRSPEIRKKKCTCNINCLSTPPRSMNGSKAVHTFMFAATPIIWPKTYTTPYSKSHNVKRSEEHTSELQSRENLVCRLLLEKKNVGVRPRRSGRAVR